MGFAHFAGSDSSLEGSIRRRTGEPILVVTHVVTPGDSVRLSDAGNRAINATWHGDTLSGTMLADGKPAGQRIRLVRRSTPFVVEQPYALWPGAVSDSQYAVTEDTLVFMKTRDGARLASYIARPVGTGPFGVVLQRTPYTRILHPAGHYWASRGYIFVAQHVRGRDVSDGTVFGDYDTDVRDGYDAVEWAAKLPGANGRVGMIGHSDEGRLAWYAAVSAPPHLAAIAPSAATADPWRIVPYEDMVFSPINVAWACLMRARTLQDIGDLDIGAALDHLPLTDLPQRLGCGDVPLWDRWIEHPTLDAYWRAHARDDEYRAGEGARAPDLRVVRRFARADRLHQRAERRAGTSVHPTRHGSGCPQGRRLRRRGIWKAITRRDTTATASLVRSLSHGEGQRRRPRAAGGRLRVRRQLVAKGSGVAARPCDAT